MFLRRGKLGQHDIQSFKKNLSCRRSVYFKWDVLFLSTKLDRLTSIQRRLMAIGSILPIFLTWRMFPFLACFDLVLVNL
jgi:hypothetical protein